MPSTPFLSSYVRLSRGVKELCSLLRQMSPCALRVLMWPPFFLFISPSMFRLGRRGAPQLLASADVPMRSARPIRLPLVVSPPFL